ncbi:MAG TPA: 16S rRNA (adenine(1518)-N(6)/adenine(1519)-N(6))-dimethyltransferase RsmA [Candidatus Bipolaricaulota bacterium]|nr:16S rRNA (adenine(1518)-N(6)/adenine(1519)-N(6))-dimethyltransferase RsmA [Candidatus Bipolaricaulota bacterium]
MKNKVLTLLSKYHLSPKKFLGQNFLIDDQVLAKIISAAKITTQDNIFEVGPGLGFLTRELLKKAKRVVAVEIDPSLFFLLKKEFFGQKKLELIKEDVLKFDYHRLKNNFSGESYKVVANLPYQITSHFLRNYLTADFPPEEMILMVQLEVAKRICAKVGDHSLLSISAQFYSRPEIIEMVPPFAFFPKPKVSSAIIKFAEIGKDKPKVDEKMFFRMVRVGFSSKRKQLRNNFVSGFQAEKTLIAQIIEKVGQKPEARAQELEMGDWVALYKELIKAKLLK